MLTTDGWIIQHLTALQLQDSARVYKKKKREPLSKLKCLFPHSISDFFPISP